MQLKDMAYDAISSEIAFLGSTIFKQSERYFNLIKDHSYNNKSNIIFFLYAEIG